MRLEVRRKLWLGDVRRGGPMIKEAAHKEIKLASSPPHVSCLGSHLPGAEGESRPPILEQYQPNPQTAKPLQ